MDYFTLISALKRQKLNIFTINDIENLFPNENKKTLKNALSRWTSQKKFVRLKKGIYEFIEPGTELNLPDLYVANRLYAPSYISLETALSVYSIIPEVTSGVTCITTKPTRMFRNKYGLFFYKSCRRRAFTGYTILKYGGFKVLIADREKALVDFLYYNRRSIDENDFDKIRLNRRILKELTWPKIQKYSALFNAKTARLIKNLKRWIGC